MKRKAFWVATCSAIIFVFCISTLSFAGTKLWPKKEGELCWYAYQANLVIDPPTAIPEDADGYVRLNVIKTGNNYYLVHGSNTEPYDEDPPDGTQLANGNAIVYSDTILMHVSSSGYGVDEVRGWLGTIELDPDTLHGHFRGVNINFDTSLPESGYNGVVKYDGIQTLIYDPDCAPE